MPEGQFWLRTGFNSRQWGGTEWQIDWNLGPFNHDAGHHVGEIAWEVASAVSGEKKDGDPPDRSNPEGVGPPEQHRRPEGEARSYAGDQIAP